MKPLRPNILIIVGVLSFLTYKLFEVDGVDVGHILGAIALIASLGREILGKDKE